MSSPDTFRRMSTFSVQKRRSRLLKIAVSVVVVSVMALYYVISFLVLVVFQKRGPRKESNDENESQPEIEVHGSSVASSTAIISRGSISELEDDIFNDEISEFIDDSIADQSQYLLHNWSDASSAMEDRNNNGEERPER
ncbi:hypothetical protein L596_018883 [Steinernema carpocapsae]|uniref:Uncharacterized protein n=1 Tax=Steinernema carpocapsae TaxID=34508 RepID=A0A4U5N5Z4_STECR|nr:hypothetical protein L596_018883 [Steinernema carpocapsae]